MRSSLLRGDLKNKQRINKPTHFFLKRYHLQVKYCIKINLIFYISFVETKDNLAKRNKTFVKNEMIEHYFLISFCPPWDLGRINTAFDLPESYRA